MGRRNLAIIIVVTTMFGSAFGASLGGATASASLGSPAFLTRSVLAESSRRGVRAGDLDGDGWNDLVSWGTNGFVSVRRADGSKGDLDAQAGIAVGGVPSSIRLAHIDAGPSLDIVAALGSLTGTPVTTGVAVLLGVGDGTFETPIVSAAASGTNPRTLAIDDLTGDGTADLVVGDATGIALSAGDGTGGFATWMPVAAGGAVNDLEIADVTDDGQLDVVATTTASSNGTGAGAVRIFPGDGSGGLGTRLDLSVRDGASAVEIGDVDEDQFPDIVAAQDAPAGGTVAVLLGRDGSVPAAAVDVSLGSNLGDLALGDIDGDTHLDLVGTDLAGGSLIVRHGSGDGTFDQQTSFAATGAPVGLALSDLAGGPHLDAATVDTGSANAMSLFENDDAGGFLAAARVQLSGATATLMVAGDATSDGRPDLLVAGSAAGKELLILDNDGHGALHPPRTLALPSVPKGLAVCRFDGGAVNDIAATTSAGVSVLLGTGSGTFATATAVAAGSATSALVATDLDGNGTCDLAVTNTDVGTVTVALGNGSGGFAAPIAYEAGTAPKGLQAVDVDGDNDLDLVTTSAGPVLSVLRNDGNATYPTRTSRTLPATGDRLAVGDFDADGSGDVAVMSGTTTSAKVLVFLGSPTGVGDGANVASATASDAFYGLAPGDVNADGNTDLVLGSADFLLGRGDGTFQQAMPTFDYDRPSFVAAVADADGNGTPDYLGHPYNALHATIVRTPVVAPPWAPFSSWTALVERQHVDLFGRGPTPAEASAATKALRSGSLTKGELVEQIRRSPDHLANVDPVVRLYRAYFLRSPDRSGLAYWVSKRRTGRTLITISESFARSSEFTHRYGSLTNRAFVSLVYANVLGRPGETSGIDYWTRQLDTRKKGRGQVMLGFSESSEYRTKQASATDAVVVYLLMLGRPPSKAELADSITALDAGGAIADLATQIMDSAPYATRLAG